jgi:hypothetical protein
VMPVITNCKQCGIQFSHPPSKTQIYCSKKCRGLWERLQSDPQSAALDAAQYRALAKSRDNAARRGISWELTHEQFVALYTSPCYLCGKSAPSGIDRVDSSKGYADGNVLACCGDCNLFKGDMNPATFLLLVERVYWYAKDQGYYDMLVKCKLCLPEVK